MPPARQGGRLAAARLLPELTSHLQARGDTSELLLEVSGSAARGERQRLLELSSGLLAEPGNRELSIRLRFGREAPSERRRSVTHFRSMAAGRATARA